MRIYTLNVGRGQFVVVAGRKEALVVDSFVPEDAAQSAFVKSALATILARRDLVGLVVTDFGPEYFCERGMEMLLQTRRPGWLLYPPYLQESRTANRCFTAIIRFEMHNVITRHRVALADNGRRFYNMLSEEFSFELFSPQSVGAQDNDSLVCKITEWATGASYLVTGAATAAQWPAIVKAFGPSLKADVLSAACHGAEGGMTAGALQCIQPHTILVSAGATDAGGQPHVSAQQLFVENSKKWYATNYGEGRSLYTVADGAAVNTYLLAL